VYKKLINRNASDRKLIFVGRLAAVAALAIAACIAPHIKSIGVFKFFQTGVTYIATPFISVLWMGILWRRTNYPAALFGIIGGAAIQAIVVWLDYQFGWNLHWLYLGAIAQVLTMLGIIVVSLITPAMAAEKVEPLLWTPSALTQFDDGRKRPWYQSLWLWLGIFALGWCFVYWRFW
jgi:SSS family solute:Na+ symporter